MTKSYLLAVDQSTSGTKALVVDRSGNVIAKSALEHKQYYPAPGYVEHDPIEIYDNVKQAAQHALRHASIDPSSLAAITITNQRETAMLWDRFTGQPIHRALVWQCQRTADMCGALKASGMETVVYEKTGLMLDPYFSATKWKWLLEYVEGASALHRQGRLLAGTIDSWLLWKLTGGAAHATDVTNASRTSLYNIHELQWDEELCIQFGVPIGILPEVKHSDAVFGYTADPSLFTEAVPIAGVIGDSQAALFGHLCLEPGTAKATYGTGTSILMNTGARPVATGHGLVTAIAWGMGGQVTYALEAVIRMTGDTIKWVRDSLGLFQTLDEMEALLARANDNEGVYLVPAFVGLGAPHWNAYARASIVGMNRGTEKAHIVRAALESIAYQVRDAAELLQRESGIPLRELRADGGAASNEFLMQFQADMLGRSIIRSDLAELSAMGSILLGGLAVGFWFSTDDVIQLQKAYKIYGPAMAEEERARLYQGWERAVESVLYQCRPSARGV